MGRTIYLFPLKLSEFSFKFVHIINGFVECLDGLNYHTANAILFSVAAEIEDGCELYKRK